MGALLAGVGATPTAARAQGKVAPVRDQLLPPVLIERSEAVYPEEALRERIEGGVGLSLTIDVEGHVTEVEVLEPAGHGFDHAARAAALRFVYGECASASPCGPHAASTTCGRFDLGLSISGRSR